MTWSAFFAVAIGGFTLGVGAALFGATTLGALTHTEQDSP